MVQYHAAPADYLALMREAMPLYDRLQKEVADASREIRVERLLDLGVGTGETTARVLALHSPTVVVVVDASSAMLEVSAEELRGQVEFRTGRLEDPLPGDSWDLIVTALSVHHLDSVGKRDLFRRCAERLREGGRLVVGDVVVPLSSVPRPTPIDPDVDFPDSAEAQLSWFSEVGLYPTLHWADGDLAVMSGTNVRA
jgi:tRNA (cmo5U34)-methyltransferase